MTKHSGSFGLDNGKPSSLVFIYFVLVILFHERFSANRKLPQYSVLISTVITQQLIYSIMINPIADWPTLFFTTVCFAVFIGRCPDGCSGHGQCSQLPECRSVLFIDDIPTIPSSLHECFLSSF